MKLFRTSAAIIFSLTSFSAVAADYPAPKQGDWVARDFKFHTGEVMPELRIHYTTVGEPSGQPVLVLHGSGGSASVIYASSSAIRGAAWRQGSEAKNIPDIWTRLCRWRRCRPRWRAATGCCGE